MKGKYIYFILILVASRTVSAQELKIESQWNEGTITLRNGSKFSGEIRYHEILDFVLFRAHGALDDQQVFQKSTILALEYFDLKENVAKQFYSLSLKDNETGEDVVDLYEVIKACNDFVVLSCKGKLQTQREKISYPISNEKIRLPHIFVKSSTLKVSQAEEFYFLSENGNSELYLTLEHSFIDAKFYKYKRNSGRVFDECVLSKYLGVHWASVMQYVRKNKIELDNREGIVAALNFYTDLLRL